MIKKQVHRQGQTDSWFLGTDVTKNIEKSTFHLLLVFEEVPMYYDVATKRAYFKYFDMNKYVLVKVV